MYSSSGMFTVEEKTTFFGITDLRTHAKKMLDSLKGSRVVITDRNEPRAVVLDYNDYQRLKEFIEIAEEDDIVPKVLKRKKQSKGKFVQEINSKKHHPVPGGLKNTLVYEGDIVDPTGHKNKK